MARLAGAIEADPGAGARRERAAQVRAAADSEARVTAALAAAEALEAARAARAVRDGKRGRGRSGNGSGETLAGAETGPEAQEARASTTDPEARVMKMADGGCRSAYNAQLVSDTATGLVVGVDIETTGSDMGRLRPMSDALEAAYGRRPREHLVDGGFAKLDDIAALAVEGVAVYAPPPTPRGGRDPHAALPGDPPAIAEWRRRMGSDDAKAVYKQRAATAEVVNAQARNRGLVRLPVRGVEKVRAVLLWHAHNMARFWSLSPA